ncbi:MAG TPA: FecR domain-containing protein [Bryobacteraceae bacterium]|nr:FecR domain-containing protein [Bryobacteraceae bacterium]
MLELLKRPAVLAGVVLSTGLIASAQTMPQPGTVSYVEGHASIDGRAIPSGSLRSTVVNTGQTLSTGMGSKAEMLLTPGVVLRIGNDSAVRMVAPSLTNTQVALTRGTAMVEVDQISPENRLAVSDQNANIRLEKTGLYSFSANPPMVAVYDGKADVQVGDRTADVGKGRELMLQANARLKTEKFDRDQQGDLYAWSKLRSEYMSEANGYSAETILAYDPGWWYGTGWYWNPYFDSWAFVPGAGYLYSPFGFGFFAPGYAYYGGHGFYGHGYYGGRHYAGAVSGFRGAPPAVAHAGGFSGGFHGGGFGGFGGGGFHGGGGRR